MKLLFRKFYKHILLFILLTAIGSFLINLIENDKKEQYLKMQAELLKSKYKTNYRYFKIMSKDIYSIYTDNNKLIKIFAEAKASGTKQQALLRQRLYKLLHKRYTRLQRMGINQVQFVFSNNISFLRMNSPELFGDNLDGIRYGITHTNTIKHSSEGFEIGRTVHGFRFVYPLYDAKHNYLGCVDISFSSEKIIENILDNYINDAHFLISQKELQKYSWQKKRASDFEKTWEMPEYLLEKASHTTAGDINLYQKIKTLQLSQAITSKAKDAKAFAISSIYNYETIVLSFIPIKNLQDQSIAAYIVTYIESDYLDNILLERYYLEVLFYSILFLLFIFGIYVIINKEKLKEMAHFDTLTKLPNRLFFYISFESEIHRAKRYKNKLAVLFIDLDRFKKVNDTYGHAIGDKVLIEVANRLSLSVRTTDIVARLAGDEFTIILTDLKRNQEAFDVANKIIRKLNEEIILDNIVIQIGASIGVSIYPEHGQDMDTLVQNADTMMYEAKNSGKNIAVIYNK